MRVREFKSILSELGFVYERPGKGDHEIWKNPKTGKSFPVDGAPGHEIPRGTLKSLWEQSGLDHLKRAVTYSQAQEMHAAHMAQAPQPGANPADNAQLAERQAQHVKNIQNSSTTQAFFDEKTGTKYLLSGDRQAMVAIDSAGTAKLVTQDADKAFNLMFDHISTVNGKMPDVVSGGMKGLSESIEQSGRGARLLGKYADDAADIAKMAGKLSKILPAVGAVAVAVETYQFLHKAGTAQRMGIISSEALNEYKALCAVSGTTGLGGFITSTGGEAAAMAAFDVWAKKNNVPDYLRKELQPDGLVRMAKDAAEKFVMADDPYTKAGAEFKAGSTDGIIAMGNVRSKIDELDLSPSNYEAAVCFTPEIEMLVENTKLVKKAENELSLASPALGNLSNASMKMSLAEGRLADSIKELADNGGLNEVINFSDDNYKKALAKPGAAEPPLEQSMMAPGDDSTLVLAGNTAKAFKL
ncbi:MAG: type II toxin-antitoxin system HicA family toxin [Micavibrio sp.]|nr:type II toxin-antitoxin system HicA family toxin [Micavibrio sp.]